MQTNDMAFRLNVRDVIVIDGGDMVHPGVILCGNLVEGEVRLFDRIRVPMIDGTEWESWVFMIDQLRHGADSVVAPATIAVKLRDHPPTALMPNPGVVTGTREP